MIVTRQGQDPDGGLVAAGDRARAAPGGIARNGPSTPLWRLRRNPCNHPHHTTDPHRARAQCAGRGARRAGGERAGCEDDVERRALAARCGGPELPARSLGSACRRLRRVKGARPAQPGALAALDPTPASGDDQRQVAGVRKGWPEVAGRRCCRIADSASIPESEIGKSRKLRGQEVSRSKGGGMWDQL